MDDENSQGNTTSLPNPLTFQAATAYVTQNSTLPPATSLQTLSANDVAKVDDSSLFAPLLPSLWPALFGMRPLPTHCKMPRRRALCVIYILYHSEKCAGLSLIKCNSASVINTMPPFARGQVLRALAL